MKQKFSREEIIAALKKETIETVIEFPHAEVLAIWAKAKEAKGRIDIEANAQVAEMWERVKEQNRKGTNILIWKNQQQQQKSQD